MKPVILTSGVSSTQHLVEPLLDTFDVAIVEPSMANAKHQKFGDKIINVSAGVDEQTNVRASSQAILTAASAISQIDELGIPHAHEWMPGFIHATMARQMILTQTLDALMSQRKIAACVVHEDVTETFSGMATWANANKVPSIHVSHNNSYLYRRPDLHDDSICKYIVGTQHVAEWYKARGYAGETKVFGLPQLDSWATWKSEKARSRELFKLSPDKPVVVYLSSWTQTTNADDDLSIPGRAFQNLIKDWDDSIQLIIKLHPAEGRDMEKAYAQPCVNAAVQCVLTRLYLDKVLDVADFIISVAPSNAQLDAAILGKPSVAVRNPGYKIDHDAVAEIEPEQIGAAMHDWKQYAERLERGRAEWLTHDATNYGHATDATVKWIKETFK